MAQVWVIEPFLNFSTTSSQQRTMSRWKRRPDAWFVVPSLGGFPEDPPEVEKVEAPGEDILGADDPTGGLGGEMLAGAEGLVGPEEDVEGPDGSEEEFPPEGSLVP
jgi:hypothetical protein